MSPYILLLILINIGIVACFLEKPILKESNEELLLSPQFPPETYKHEHQRTPRYVVFLIHKIRDFLSWLLPWMNHSCYYGCE